MGYPGDATGGTARFEPGEEFLALGAFAFGDDFDGTIAQVGGPAGQVQVDSDSVA
jgi:hypothetical protein